MSLRWLPSRTGQHNPSIMYRAAPKQPLISTHNSRLTTRLCSDRLLTDIMLVLDVLHRDAWLGWLRVVDLAVLRLELRWSLEVLGHFRPSCCTCLAMSRLLLVFSR